MHATRMVPTAIVNSVQSIAGGPEGLMPVCRIRVGSAISATLGYLTLGRNLLDFRTLLYEQLPAILPRERI